MRMPERLSQLPWVAAALMLCLLLSPAVLADEQHMGAWIDEIIFVEEPSQSAAITRLAVGELDVHASAISDAELFQRVMDNPGLEFERSFGSYSELTFNPAGPVFPDTGELNPFAVPAIRQAMNWLIDRNYITQELYGGMAVPRFFPITSAFPDYARMPEHVRRLELLYAHDPDRAAAVIAEEMEALGAVLENGVWHYEGSPVELIFVIRTEDERLDIGDYVASLLEDIGFLVDRQYKTAAEASPIWIGSDPNAGLFHVYTGGWVTTVVSRDQATNFDFFYTPRGLAFPLWQAYEPTEEFDEVANRLGRRDFTTLEERTDLFVQAMELSLEDSVRIWLADEQGITPRQADISVAADLAGGVSGAFLWAHTIQRNGEIGGELTIGLPSVIPEPWNPLDGSNWLFDMMLIRGTSDFGFVYDPFTGLHHPQRAERAEVFIKEGLPVERTLDWVTLEFVEENVVPDDAWIDWDPIRQEFISVGEKHPEGLTANRKTIVHYPEELYDTTWHDGSEFSIADIVMAMILSFDRAKEDSQIFDPAQVPSFESFMQQFRGVRIVSENPLIIENYSDAYYLDAEQFVGTWYPYYAQGPGAWHTLALGIRAEVNQELAFSQDKADKLRVEWLNMVAGPSLEVLKRNLDEAVFVPYAPTLDRFISSEEAIGRWNNMRQWYADKGHFWIGSGPFYLERAFPVEGMVHLKRFADFPDPAAKWLRFGEPMIAEAEIEGPARVSVGDTASFDIWIDFAGEPYPTELLSEVKFLLFDAVGDLAHIGSAELVEEGWWTIELDSDLTAGLAVGANRLEVIVSPTVVSLPTFENVQFVTVP